VTRLPISLSSARLRRRVLLLAYSSILVVLVVITTAPVVLLSGRSRGSVGDRAVLIGDVIAGSTWLLALIAALIALQAYAAATGLPDLKIQVWFNDSAKNHPIFRLSRLPDGTIEKRSPSGQTLLITLSNKSGYSARGPAVKICLHGMKCEFVADKSEWTAIESASDGGVWVIQWDSGSEYAIHGGFARQLPLVDLGRVYGFSDSEPPTMTVAVVADGGYKRVLTLPVTLIRDSAPSHSNSVARSVPDWL